MSDKIQVRRGTAAQLAAITLSAGEPGLTTDTKKMYVGDGTTNLPVAMATQEAWISPTLTNAWVNFGSGLATAAYMKDDLGFVTIKGYIKSGTLNLSAFTLPVGYRPLETLTFANESNAAFASINVLNDGTVVPKVGTPASGIAIFARFRAEQ